jgi:membrane protein YdbS with pleckstrin-like domain
MIMVLFTNLKRIIRRMLEFARRLWSICIPAFAVLVVGGCAPLYYLDGKWYQLLVSIIVWFLALICLIIAIITLNYDFRITWQKYYKEKHRPPPEIRFL